MPNEYAMLEKEDPSEMIHRRAQFLIQKILQRADTETLRRQQKRSILIRTSSFRVVGMRVKIGKKLRKLRKSCVVANKYSDLMPRFLKSLRRYFLCSSSRNVSDLPPLFAIHVWMFYQDYILFFPSYHVIYIMNKTSSVMYYHFSSGVITIWIV